MEGYDQFSKRKKMINFDGVIKVGTKKHNSTRPNIILEY